jgi:ribosome-binding factor A
MTRKHKSAGSRGGAAKGGAARGGTRGSSQRQLRVGEEMRHALAHIIGRDALDDPDLAHHPVTVTAVDVSPDLRNATAFVVPFGVAVGAEIDTAAMIAALNRAAGFFRGQLAREVNLRVSPHIRFRLDESFQQANRIEALLNDPAVARDLGNAAEEGEAIGKSDGEDSDGAA